VIDLGGQSWVRRGLFAGAAARQVVVVPGRWFVSVNLARRDRGWSCAASCGMAAVAAGMGACRWGGGGRDGLRRLLVGGSA